MEVFSKVIEKIQGERLTIQRRLVLEALCQQPGHQTLAQIQAYIQAAGLELPEPTIYRILQWLKEQQVISQTDIGAARVVYELITTPPHHHLICLHCGSVTEIEDACFNPLRLQLQATYGFAPRIEHMAIYGKCAACTTP